MKRSGRHLWGAIVCVFVFAGYLAVEVQAASSSCRSDSEEKLDCMEFTGNLPAALESICNLAGRAKWVDGPCPQDNVLGYCDLPKSDDIQQRSYCYRMAEMPDAERTERCRTGCSGAFLTVPGEPSVPAPATDAPSPASTNPAAAPSVTAPPQQAAPIAAPEFEMELDTNRYGEDFKNLSLRKPNPALCARACMKAKKCKAWTYVKPGIQDERAVCWLKDKVPPPTPDENCVSGVKKKQK